MKPPRITRQELSQIYDKVLERWKAEDRPNVAKLWWEEIWNYLVKRGYVKKK